MSFGAKMVALAGVVDKLLTALAVSAFDLVEAEGAFFDCRSWLVMTSSGLLVASEPDDDEEGRAGVS